MCCKFVFFSIFLMLYVGSVTTQPKWTHGRRALMLEPPQRSSLWRFGNETPLNINDSALNCGGFERQWEKNNGACGICGDPADGPQDHDENGIYDSNIIVKTYTEGGYVNITVEVESNMLGYFEFRLCDRNSSDEPLTQECFDKNLLWIEESWNFRYYVGSHGGLFDLHVRLGENVICSHCVLQWKYSTGHRMGGVNSCAEMGSGRQEQFYNCADVEIVSKRKDAMYERPLLSIHENIYLVPHELTYNLTAEELDLLKDEIRKITPGMKQTIPNGFLEPLEFNYTLPIPFDKFFSKSVSDLHGPWHWLENVTHTDGHHDHHGHHHTHSVTTTETNTPPPIKPMQTEPPPDILRDGMIVPPPPSNKLTFRDGLNESRRRQIGDRVGDQKRNKAPRKSPMYAIGDSYVFPVFRKNRIRDRVTSMQPTTSSSVSTDNGVSATPEECTVHSPKFHCVGKGQYKDNNGINKWCLNHCQKDSCVEFMCECGCHTPVVKPKCRANGPFQIISFMNEWCKVKCDAGICPPNICIVDECLPKKS